MLQTHLDIFSAIPVYTAE